MQAAAAIAINFNAPAKPAPPKVNAPPRYSKKAAIGSGAFGTCFIAKDNHSGETRVVKEIKLKGLDSKEVKRSVSEAKVLQRISHPNIISFYHANINRADGILSIVMEHAAGGDLAGLIQERQRSGRRFSEDECLKVITQACSALAYCHHDLFLLHRDVKPQNLFLASAKPGHHGRTPGDVRLGDFGISKSLAASHGLAVTKCGSPVYMSPELCSGRPYDRGCDVWALGCVLYEMMALSPPWIDQLPRQHGILPLMRLVCSGTLDFTPLRRHYSAELLQLLQLLLHKQPQQRPSFRKILQHVPCVRRTLAKLSGADAPTPTSPVSTPPLSPVADADDSDDAVATGDNVAPTADAATAHAASPPPTPTPPARRMNAAAAAAKHVNVFDAFARPAAGYNHENPFNARSPPLFYRGQQARAHGVDAHAAAMVVQRSFHAARRRRPVVPVRAAGMPSRAPPRPVWAPVR